VRAPVDRSQVGERLGGRPAPQVDRQPASDGEHEAGHRPALRVVSVSRLPEPHERLLHQLLREPGVTEQPEAQPVESRRIAVVQLLEGVAEISAGDPCDQLRVIFTHVRGMMPQRFISLTIRGRSALLNVGESATP